MTFIERKRRPGIGCDPGNIDVIVVGHRQHRRDHTASVCTAIGQPGSVFIGGLLAGSYPAKTQGIAERVQGWIGRRSDSPNGEERLENDHESCAKRDPFTRSIHQLVQGFRPSTPRLQSVSNRWKVDCEPVTIGRVLHQISPRADRTCPERERRTNDLRRLPDRPTSPLRANATFGLVKPDTARSLLAAISADRSLKPSRETPPSSANCRF